MYNMPGYQKDLSLTIKNSDNMCVEGALAVGIAKLSTEGVTGEAKVVADRFCNNECKGDQNRVTSAQKTTGKKYHELSGVPNTKII